MPKISELPEETSANANDLLPIVNIAGVITKKLKASALASSIASLFAAKAVSLSKLNGGTTAGRLITSASGVVSVVGDGIVQANLDISSVGSKSVATPFTPRLAIFSGAHINSDILVTGGTLVFDGDVVNGSVFASRGSSHATRTRVNQGAVQFISLTSAGAASAEFAITPSFAAGGLNYVVTSASSQMSLTVTLIS